MSSSTRFPPFLAPRVLAAGAALLLVAAVTLAPQSLAGPLRSVVMDAAVAVAAPLVAGMSFHEIESTLNAALFVPLGAGFALLLGRRLWGLAPLIGIALSLTVESVQAQLPGRVPDLNDIVWNSVGALLGALVVGLFLSVRWARWARWAGGARKDEAKTGSMAVHVRRASTRVRRRRPEGGGQSNGLITVRAELRAPSPDGRP